MGRLRIALVIPTLDQSGAEKQLTLLAVGLPKDEFDVRVFALSRGGPYQPILEQAGIPVTVIGKRWKFDPWALRRLSRQLHDWQPDIVHSWLFAANAATRLIRTAKAPWKQVVSERCVDSWKAGWQLWLDRRLRSRTDLLVGNSTSVAEFYTQLGYPASHVMTIPNGVEASTASRSDRSPQLAKLGIPDDAFVVGYIGRLAIQKRVRDLVWAAETLWQIRRQLHLIIVGDGPERERLEEFSAGVHGPGHIHFVGHSSEPQRWLGAFDTLWLGSSFEGMSNSVMEGMAAGLPVVATDIAANRELVVPDETGFLVPVGDAVGFMQFTRRLIDEPGLRAALGAAGQQRMQSEFSVARMIERYADLYRRVMAKAE